MFWQYRLDLREVVRPIQQMSEKDLVIKLPAIKESIADKLENSSVFRKSSFPARFRDKVGSVPELHLALEELYDFAFEQKVWLGL